MEKTTVYLPAPLKKQLRTAARQRRMSEAALIREALESAVAPRPHFPLFDSGDPTFASRVDELLEDFGMDSLPPDQLKRYEKKRQTETPPARR